MKSGKACFAQSCSLALALVLGGCGSGGGGTSSTPTPTPAPTPTPTPTPTPVATNDDLVAPLVSESFANEARRASASYSSAGALSAESQAAQSLTISYDAGTNSYTLSVPGRSQTFRPADLGPGGWRRTNGGVTDDLTLTPTGTGTSALMHRYVAAGFWQRQTVTASGIDGSIDAFVYGVPTATLVRSGKAYYAFDLLGALNMPGEPGPDALRGSGTLTADLGAGTIRGGADFLLYRVDGSRVSNSSWDGVFSTSGTIASTGNGFSGTVQLLTFGNFQGNLTGRFFGPDAVEIGASFSATDANGHVAVGALIGRTDPALALPGLANLPARTTFRGGYAMLNGGSYYLPVITLDPATGAFEIPADVAGAPGALSFGNAQKLATQADTRFTDYALTQNGQDVTLRAYRVGSANSQLQLTYTSFALLTARPTGSTAVPDLRSIFYGVHTDASAVPRAGSANYAGVIYGAAQDQASARYDLTGTSSFAVNFGTLAVSGSLHPLLTKVSDGSTLEYGTVAFGPLILDRTSYIGFNGPIGGDGSQMMQAFFFGPQAEEIGAMFNLRRYDGLSGNSLTLSGVTVAKVQ